MAMLRMTRASVETASCISQRGVNGDVGLSFKHATFAVHSFDFFENGINRFKVAAFTAKIKSFLVKSAIVAQACSLSHVLQQTWVTRFATFENQCWAAGNPRFEATLL